MSTLTFEQGWRAVREELQASIDLHPWMSRRQTPDSPDYLVIDLDPKQAPFADVVRIARALGKLLVGIGLRPLLKTSGKTGLHVVIPLAPGYTYDQARGFAEAVARVVAREHPDIATVERTISEREGKVYVDGRATGFKVENNLDDSHFGKP